MKTTSGFRQSCQSTLTFETLQDVSKVLGGTHLIKEGEVQLDMHEFADVACKLYQQEQECKDFRVLPGIQKGPCPVS